MCIDFSVFSKGAITSFLAVLLASAAVAGTPQSITFPPLIDRVNTESLVSLQATASSGLPVTYTITSPAGVATVSGSSVSLTGTTGGVTVKASQAGNGTYDPAPDVYRSFTVGLATQRFSKLATNAHGSHEAAIKPDGTLWGWGDNSVGQFGDGVPSNWRTTPGKVGTATTWASVSCGFRHTAALRTDGSLWTSGYNGNGQLGSGSTTDRNTLTRVGTLTWLAVSCGENHTVAVRSDGTLWACGDNQWGQLGDNSTTQRTSLVQIGSVTTWAAVACGFDHTLALRSDGTLWAWGSGNHGRLGDGTSLQRNSPVKVGTATTWSAISAGYTHSLALRSNGTLWAWGNNLDGQLATDNVATSSSNVPLQVAGPATWASVSAGDFHSTGRRQDGTLWTWGSNYRGQSGTAAALFSFTPLQVPNAVGAGTAILGRYNSTTVLQANGTLQALGEHAGMDYGVSYVSPNQLGGEAYPAWKELESGDQHTVAIAADGTLWTWGSDFFGQLGNGALSFEFVPSKISEDTRWIRGAGGEAHSAALRGDGTLWTWGGNSTGQLGDGTTTNRDAPVQVGTGTSWTYVDCGALHTAALRSDGTLWTWGDNQSGKLGDGSSTDRSSPVQIGTATNWTHVACGDSHTMAVQADGTLWGWGSNDSGRLGDGTTTPRSSPVQIGTAANWERVACGASHTIGLRKDGTLWAWGHNGSGQLGDGTTTMRTAPVQIGAGTTWSSIATGTSHSFATRRDGTLWAWGSNSSAELGDGTYTARNAPVQVGTATNWAMASCSIQGSVALRTDGTSWGWASYRNNRVVALNTFEPNSVWPLRTAQTLTFPALPAITQQGQSVIVPAASATSGLPVTLTVAGPATLVGNVLTATGPGNITVAAYQNGSPAWFVAPSVVRTQSLAPAVTVTGNGQPIANNDATPTAADHTDFGRVYTSSGTLTRTFTLANSGNADLILTSVTLGGPHGGDFSVTAAPAAVVAMGGTTSFQVTFDPAADDARTATLNISTNDPAVPYFSFALGGIGHNPAQTITFPEIADVLTTSGTVTLGGSVVSGLPITYSIVSSPAGVGTLSGSTLTLAGVAGSVTVKASQPGNGMYDPAADVYRTFTVRADSDRFVQVATNAGSDSGAGIRPDGTLWTWGSNLLGRLGRPTLTEQEFTPGQVGTATNWTAVSCGQIHMVALRADGTLWAWGQNAQGQLGDGTTTNRSAPVQVGTSTTWASVVCGAYHNMAQRTDGTLWAWGQNVYGQLGDGSTTNRSSPVQIGAVTTWSSVSCGFGHTVAARTTGSVWSWGSNAYGQLGDGTITNRSSPAQVGAVTTWTKVACGSQHTTALRTNGTLWAWGNNADGQLGDGSTTQRRSPVQIGTATTWTAVAGGYFHTAARRTNGTLWTWGTNEHGQLGDGTQVDRLSPVQVGNATDWTSAVCGFNHTVALRSDGTLWAWGDHTQGQLGDGNTTRRGVPEQAGAASTWAAAGSAGEDHTAMIRTNGTLWTWGGNAYGQLGDGTTTARHTQQQVGSATDWQAVACGESHTVGLRADGSLWSWGRNLYGQLGDGTTTDRSSPSQAGTGSTWKYVACGRFHTLAIRADNTLWAWGVNFQGQVGDGTTTHRSSPVQVGGNTQWTAVAAGSDFTVALRADGALLSWGANGYGQLGDGSASATRSTPGLVTGNSDWVSITCGRVHAAARRADGTLWCWGHGSYGALGDGTETSQGEPVQAGTATNWTAVSCGGDHTLARRADGTLWAWGYNSMGQLGDGTQTERQSPVQVGISAAWTFMVGGLNHSAAVRADGTLWAWGANGTGQLGTLATVAPLRVFPGSAFQSLNFPALPATAFVGYSFSLAATAGSSLPVAYHVTGPATLSGGVLTTTGPGTVIITATQPGDSAWQRAMPAMRTLQVQPPFTPASWRQTHFGTTANSGTAADTADADNDGVPNLVEYAFGLSPVSGSAGPAQLPQPQHDPSPQTFTYTFTEPAGVTGITYTAQATTSLASGSWTSIPDTGSGTTHIFSVPTTGQPQMFIRLQVSSP